MPRTPKRTRHRRRLLGTAKRLLLALSCRPVRGPASPLAVIAGWAGSLGTIGHTSAAEVGTGRASGAPEGERAVGVDQTVEFAPVLPNRPLAFPQDHGAHPAFRTEWWYLTAWVETRAGPAGVQVTFFRSRTPFGRDNPSRFAPRQILFAHAAFNAPANEQPVHAQIARRADGAHARFSTEDTDLLIGPPSARWRMQRTANDSYQIEIDSQALSLRLSASADQPPWQQGRNGYSRKGPAPEQASHYYSRPWLSVRGSATVRGESLALNQGTGWLDHEFSSTLLAPGARGWDWVGLHMDDGAALMAFQIRGESGGALWRDGAWRDASGHTHVAHTRFKALRWWQSARSGIRYPVEMALTVRRTEQPAAMTLHIEPLMDDQEIDARLSTGMRYWEGAVRVNDAASGKPLGKGYLELTGYGEKLRL